MSTVPPPEVPPPDTPNGHGPNPRTGPVRTPRHERTGPRVSATVRLCLVDPAADTDEIITAAVSMITTTYTAPGDRIMLADPRTPTTDANRMRRDRLVESVFRLGRSAITGPDIPPHGDHELTATVGDLPWPPESGSGLGPQPGNATDPVTKPTTRPTGPGSDGVDVIITGWSEPPASPSAMADFTRALAPAGTLVVLTHSSTQNSLRSLHTKQPSRAAALAGLLVTDRLNLVHQLPDTPRNAMQNRRAMAFGGHRRIHTTASVFRRPSPPPEVRHA